MSNIKFITAVLKFIQQNFGWCAIADKIKCIKKFYLEQNLLTRTKYGVNNRLHCTCASLRLSPCVFKLHVQSAAIPAGKVQKRLRNELAQYLCLVFVVLQATNAVQTLQVYPPAPPYADTVHYEMRPQMHLQKRTSCIHHIFNSEPHCFIRILTERASYPGNISTSISSVVKVCPLYSSVNINIIKWVPMWHLRPLQL